MLLEYRNFNLAVEEAGEGEGGAQRLRVWVEGSPADRTDAIETTIPPDLAGYDNQLERRRLAPDRLTVLGEALADLILPAPIRERFLASLDALQPEQGLRVRLRLSPGLAPIAWEYLYIRRGTSRDATGYLALDPRISIVRHVSTQRAATATPRPRRLLAVLGLAGSSPPRPVPEQKKVLEAALAQVPGLKLDFLEAPGQTALRDALASGLDIFHLEGTGSGHWSTTVGDLVLADAAGQPLPLAAEQLAINLHGGGPRLAVLNSLETDACAGRTAWPAAASAIVRAGVPAVVAMQFKLRGETAAAFTRRFYQTLAAGASVDQAVSAGRLDVYNLVAPLQGDPQRREIWRDWGVPILCSTENPTSTQYVWAEGPPNQEATVALRLLADHRFQEIGATGKYNAFTLGTVAGGTIEARLHVEVMRGTVTQLRAKQITAGNVTLTATVGTLEGDFTGAHIDTLGGPALDWPPPVCPPTVPELRCEWCANVLKLPAPFCPHCGQPLSPPAPTPPAEGQVDLTVRIRKGPSGNPGELLWTFETPHGGVALPGKEIITNVGTDRREFAIQLVHKVNAREGRNGLFTFLRGIGLAVADELPAEFWGLLAAVAQRVAPQPPTLLLLSEDPYIPWELAVVEPRLDDQRPPFLAAQAVVGRWALHKNRPKTPPTRVDFTGMAVVRGVYKDMPRLKAAEEEAEDLKRTYQAAPVEAVRDDVLKLLGGSPPASLLHFAVHGIYDPQSSYDGLVLVDGQYLDPFDISGAVLPGAPFVFLNACQVGSGREILGSYQGVAAAFLYAGAAAVVAPLWSVSDTVAREIALRFYSQALGGPAAAELLRAERAAFGPSSLSAASLAYQFFGHPSLRLRRAAT
jgi:hypothetical protein